MCFTLYMCTRAPWWANMSGNPAEQHVTCYFQHVLALTQCHASHTMVTQHNQCSIKQQLWWNTWRLDDQTLPRPGAQRSAGLRWKWAERVDKSSHAWRRDTEWLTAYECLTDVHFSQSKGQRTEMKISKPSFQSKPFSILLHFHNELI